MADLNKDDLIARWLRIVKPYDVRKVELAKRAPKPASTRDALARVREEAKRRAA